LNSPINLCEWSDKGIKEGVEQLACILEAIGVSGTHYRPRSLARMAQWMPKLTIMLLLVKPVIESTAHTLIGTDELQAVSFALCLETRIDTEDENDSLGIFANRGRICLFALVLSNPVKPIIDLALARATWDEP
jgi:hypothetical protein